MRSGRRILGRGEVDHLLLCKLRLKSMTFLLVVLYVLDVMLYVRYVRLCLLDFVCWGSIGCFLS